MLGESLGFLLSLSLHDHRLHLQDGIQLLLDLPILPLDLSVVLVDFRFLLLLWHWMMLK